MSTVLGPLFDQPLHHKSWCRFGSDRGKLPECPRFDYRITAGFHDVDLVNGGEHQAVDCGNASKGYPEHPRVKLTALRSRMPTALASTAQADQVFGVIAAVDGVRRGHGAWHLARNSHRDRE